MNNNDYKVSVPEGVSGDWRVEKFTVSESEAKHFNAMSSFSFGGGGRSIDAGTYTRLMRSGTIVMSDTPAEVWDHIEPIRRAKGRVLLAGLGIGVVLQACLKKPEVEHVDVVELSGDVLNLVSSHYFEKFGNKRLEIYQDDIFTWMPPRGLKYDVCWFDIFDDICLDNLPLITRLKKRFKWRCGWRGAWSEVQLRAQARR